MTKDLSFVGLNLALSRSAPSRKGELLALLPEGAAGKFQSLAPTQMEPLKDLSLEELVDQIHQSHFIPSLGGMVSKDRIFYLSSFPSKKQKELIDELKEEKRPYAMQKGLSSYVLKGYVDENLGEESMRPPRSTLRDSPLLFLLDRSLPEICSLCRYLGLFDILFELKRVLRSSILKNLEKALSPDELSFVGDIQKTRNPIHFANIGLDDWDGNKDSLLKVLEMRGLNRIAKASFQESDAFVWYFTHILDVEKAREFHKLRGDLEDLEAFQIIRDQVITTWKRICTASH